MMNYNRPMGHQIIEAMIDASAVIGEGSLVWHYAVILAGVRIGRDCSIGSRCEIGRGSTIGDRSRIGSGVFLPPNSTIGADVFIGPNVTCTDDRLPRVHADGDAPYLAQPPVIEDGAVVGAGAVLLPGVRIGAGARVGAGSVVAKDIPPARMVRGEPARERAMAFGWEPDTSLRA